MTIDILLATYNGEAFLPAQIRSLQNQTFTDWRLLVHDDGSSDNSINIVKEFAKNDTRIRLIEDNICFHSATYNFLHLLQYSDAPFAIFCDDDDIWLENKLSVLYEEIQKRDNSIPQAVWCNSYVYITEKAMISGKSTLSVIETLHDVLFSNSGIQGCAILFNAALRKICHDKPEHIAMHDHLLTLAATTFGEMTYVPQCLMLYRRHDKTVTGETAKNKKERLGKFFQKGKTVIDRRHHEAILSFYDLHKTQMQENKKELYQKYLQYFKRNRISNALHILPDGFKIYQSSIYLIIKLILRPLI